MKKIFLCLMMVLLLSLAGTALADDVYTLAINQADGMTVSTGVSYLRVTCDNLADEPVTLSIYDGWGSLVYQRNYGVCVGSFRSEDVYLRLNGGETMYRVSLRCGGNVYETNLLRKLPRLENNTACSAGFPVAQITGKESRQTLTMLDTAATALAPVTVPLHASGVYDLGTATFYIQDGNLVVQVDLRPGIEAVLGDHDIWVAPTSVAASTLTGRKPQGIRGRLNTPIDLQGAAYVAVYVKLTVSFNPGGAAVCYDTEVAGQQEMWHMLEMQTEMDAVG